MHLADLHQLSFFHRVQFLSDKKGQELEELDKNMEGYVFFPNFMSGNSGKVGGKCFGVWDFCWY